MRSQGMALTLAGSYFMLAVLAFLSARLEHRVAELEAVPAACQERVQALAEANRALTLELAACQRGGNE